MMDENPYFWLDIKLPIRARVDDDHEPKSYVPSTSKLCNLLRELHGEDIFTNNRWIIGKRKKSEKKVRFLLLEVEDDLPYCRYKHQQSRSGQIHASVCKNFTSIEELGAEMWMYRSRILAM